MTADGPLRPGYLPRARYAAVGLPERLSAIGGRPLTSCPTGSNTSACVEQRADETIAWLSRAPEPPRTVYVVHGEQHAAASLADRLHTELGWSAIVPAYGERVLLD